MGGLRRSRQLSVPCSRRYVGVHTMEPKASFSLTGTRPAATAFTSRAVTSSTTSTSAAHTRLSLQKGRSHSPGKEHSRKGDRRPRRGPGPRPRCCRKRHPRPRVRNQPADSAALKLACYRQRGQVDVVQLSGVARQDRSLLVRWHVGSVFGQKLL